MRLLLLLAAFVSIAAPVPAQTTGLPDPTFGTGGGVVLDPSGTLQSAAADVAVLPDGRILLAGRIGADAAVVRLTEAGALDASFGTGGAVRIPFDGPRAGFTSLAVLPGGAIVAAGLAQDDDDTAIGAVLVRLTPAGVLDPSFGTAGVVREAPAAASAFLDLAVQPDGRLVAIGQFEQDGNGDSRFVAVRYLADGSRDDAFGAGGRAAPAAVAASGDALALDAQGRIIVTGSADTGANVFESEIRTARLTPAGALDATFGTGGIVAAVLPAAFNIASAVVVDAQGRATVGGAALSLTTGAASVVLLRYTASGAPDATFGTAGIVRTSTFGQVAIAFDLALQADGKLLVGGAAGTNDSANFLLARYTAAGALDPAFGAGGRTLLDLGDTDAALALAFEPNGRVVLAGQTGNADGSETRIAVARVTTDGRPTAGEDSAAPGAFALAAAPNPFQSTSAVTLTLDEAGAARVSVYDALGRRVAVLHDGALSSGPHAFRLDGGGLAPGVYVVRAEGARGAASVRVVRR